MLPKVGFSWIVLLFAGRDLSWNNPKTWCSSKAIGRASPSPSHLDILHPTSSNWEDSLVFTYIAIAIAFGSERVSTGRAVYSHSQAHGLRGTRGDSITVI